MARRRRLASCDEHEPRTVEGAPMKFRHLFSRKKNLTARGPVRRRPTIEMLEDRLVPTLNFQGLVPDLSSGQIMEPIQIHSDASTPIPITLSLSAQTSSGTPLLGGTVTRMTDAATGVATF